VLTGLMGGVFLLALVVIYKDTHPRYQQFAPGLLTTLGILGTFVGISIGLANFDANDIDGSIPPLLDGLKTAFITSIVGIALSIFTRATFTWVRRSDGDGNDDSASWDIPRTLVAIRQEMEKSNVIAEKTRAAIAGEGEASVVTQLQKVRAS